MPDALAIEDAESLTVSADAAVAPIEAGARVVVMERPAPSAAPDAVRLLRRMAKSLGTYGASVNRIEDALTACARAIGVEAEFFATPTGVLVTVVSGDEHRAGMAAITSSEVHLERLALLDRLLGDIIARRVGVRDALERLDEIERSPRRYGAPVTFAAFAMTSASAALLFRGSWIDAAAAGAAGALVGLATWGAAFGQTSVRLVEFLAGVLAAVAGAWASTRFGAHPATVTLAALIVLVPGVSITTAMNELATRHLVAGSARFMGALLVLVMLGFGVAVGQRVAVAIGVAPVALPAAAPAPGWAMLIPLGTLVIPLLVLFKAPPRLGGWLLAAALIGFFGARLGGEWIGPGLGAGVGALLVGITANATARLFDRPAAIMAAPGVLLLVPGSVGYRSVDALMNARVEAGVETAFNMLMIAASIVTGLLLAALVVPPRRAL